MNEQPIKDVLKDNLEDGLILMAFKKDGKLYAQIQNIQSQDDFDDMAHMCKSAIFNLR